jgi:YebC/PmpR family DNA-binding regulatory protein
MSGHSKWAKIKRAKGAEDQRKGKVFSMLVKTITVEVKRANGDRNSPGVKKAIERARAANMPNENIERAIKNASGAGSVSLEEVAYEAYGPGGTALILEGITDNRNRSSQEIKFLLSKNNASLAAPGSATWAFQKSPEGGWIPQTTVELKEADAQGLAKLLDALEENEDIKNVYHNAAGFDEEETNDNLGD